MQSVRADAPWCPDNHRVHPAHQRPGLRRGRAPYRFRCPLSRDGIGDVYLGAPVAVPLDPRHRLVTTKYNPARTWTPPNVVGIGGAYMCIYGMEGPGGYQLFGRTIQVWNSYLQSPEFRDGNPGCCASSIRSASFRSLPRNSSTGGVTFPSGGVRSGSRRKCSGCATISAFSRRTATIELFQALRQAAFDARTRGVGPPRRSRARRCVADSGRRLESIRRAGQAPSWSKRRSEATSGDSCRPGDHREGFGHCGYRGMKTECNVPSPATGIVRAVYIRERQQITPGTPIIALEPSARMRAGE